VEALEGLLVCSFLRPSLAIRWALTTVRDCLALDWPPELLGHELGEEIAVRALVASGGAMRASFLATARTGAQPQQPPAPPRASSASNSASASASHSRLRPAAEASETNGGGVGAGGCQRGKRATCWWCMEGRG
jgi:hypothetical protein